MPKFDSASLVAHGVGLLHEWLSENSAAPGVPISKQIRAAADAGDQLAQKVIASGLLNDPDATVTPPAPAAPMVPPAVIDRERRLATQQLPPNVRNAKEPTRPIVHSGATRDWLTR